MSDLTLTQLAILATVNALAEEQYKNDPEINLAVVERADLVKAIKKVILGPENNAFSVTEACSKLTTGRLLERYSFGMKSAFSITPMGKNTLTKARAALTLVEHVLKTETLP